MKVTLTVLTALFLGAAPGQGAEMLMVRDGDLHILSIEGEIVEGDAAKLFEAAKSSRTIDRVSLNSQGGDLGEGIILAKLFQSLQLTVYVMQESICASACAVAYMGGTTRLIQRGAALGLHAPFRIADLDIEAPLRPDRGAGRTAENLRTRILITQIAKENGIDQIAVDLMYRQLSPSRLKNVDVQEGMRWGLYTRVID